LKALAISGDKPFPNPRVPTFTQAGLPGFDVGLWYGLLAGGGTPKHAIDRLATDVNRILAMPDFREKVTSLGLEIFVSTPEQYVAMLRAESQKFARVVKAAGIKQE
jgi:tripartite-type tricarboxylate transporter receptor subunit TctC